jgi:hypothetical protein
MNIREQLHKVRYGSICRWGGDKKQTTQNTSQSIDSRSIVTNTLDGGAIAGALDFAKDAATTFGSLGKSAVDSSALTTGRALDYGQDLFTTAASSVSRTADGALTRYADLFDTAASGMASQAARSQVGYENLFSQSLDAVTSGAQSSQQGYADLFGKSLGFVEAASNGTAKAYDRASSVQASAMSQLQGAYADAKGTSDSQKQIMIGALVVAGLVVLMKT